MSEPGHDPDDDEIEAAALLGRAEDMSKAVLRLCTGLTGEEVGKLLPIVVSLIVAQMVGDQRKSFAAGMRLVGNNIIEMGDKFAERQKQKMRGEERAFKRRRGQSPYD